MNDSPRDNDNEGRQNMADYKPGLHKDVEDIFSGVWNAQDNIQHFVKPASDFESGLINPIMAQKSQKSGKVEDKKAQPDSGKPLKSEWNRWFPFSKKKRQERRRLLSISKFLMLPPEK
jgi:hypothetical protein